MIDTLGSLVDAGRIRSYGWSTDDPERGVRFADGANCTAVQFQLNAFADTPQTQLPDNDVR